MKRVNLKHFCAATLGGALAAKAVLAEPLFVPFDFSRSEIGVVATIKVTPVYVFLDSGVDPSTIDLARARALHLKIGPTGGGEVSGTGSGKAPQAFPTTIKGLGIAGRPFAGVDAVALDLGAISAKYGRRVDAVLGFSFLRDKSVLIDYRAHVLEVLSKPTDGDVATRSCRTKWNADLRLVPGDNWPSFAAFRLGRAFAHATLDTGSNSYLMLYQGALALPGLSAVLADRGTAQAGGFRGRETRKQYALLAPIGFGPFSLPPGTPVTITTNAGPTGVVANVGNKFFAALKLKMLLDYRTHHMTFFGNCS